MTITLKGNVSILYWALALVLVAAPTPAAAQTTIGMVVDADLDFYGELGNNQVHVFDADTREVLDSFFVSNDTGDCSISADGSTGYLTNGMNDVVQVVDLTSPFMLGTAPTVATDPALDTSLSADGSFLVICDGGVSTPPISVVDTATNMETSTLQLTGAGGTGVACNSVAVCDNNDVLVTTGSFEEVRRLTLNGLTGALTDTGASLFLAAQPQNVLCGPGGATGVVVLDGIFGAPEFVSFTTASMTPVDSGALTNQAGSAAVFGEASAINAAGDRVYVRSFLPFFDPLCPVGGPACGLIEVHDFDSTTAQLGATAAVNDPPTLTIGPVLVETGAFGVDSIALHPDGSKLFVSEHAGFPPDQLPPAAVNVYDTATGALIGPLSDTPGGATPSTAIGAPTGVCVGSVGDSGNVEFADFDGTVKITLGEGSDDDTVALNTTFTLGTDNDGFDLDTEDLTIEVMGDPGVSVTIPAGSFVVKTNPAKTFFKFDGVIDGVAIELKIDVLGGDSFTFKGSLANVNLDDTVPADPVTVSLTIGDDSGSFDVLAIFL